LVRGEERKKGRGEERKATSPISRHLLISCMPRFPGGKENPEKGRRKKKRKRRGKKKGNISLLLSPSIHESPKRKKKEGGKGGPNGGEGKRKEMREGKRMEEASFLPFFPAR